jgi:hypothetical protein
VSVLGRLGLGNLPSVTDWISSISSFVSAVAVVCGLIFARQQLNSWRTEAKETRKRELAEEVWATAHKVIDEFRSLRNSFSSIPVSEIANRGYDYERRYKQLRTKDALFESLRDLQIRAKSILQDQDVDAAIDGIANARIEFANSLNEIVELQSEKIEMNSDLRQMMIDARKIVYGRFDNSDEFGKKLNSRLTVLETKLGPTMRLAKN